MRTGLTDPYQTRMRFYREENAVKKVDSAYDMDVQGYLFTVPNCVLQSSSRWYITVNSTQTYSFSMRTTLGKYMPTFTQPKCHFHLKTSAHC